jgi:signal transduction histidine kinase/ActR/RegA family two-component response regulator
MHAEDQPRRDRHSLLDGWTHTGAMLAGSALRRWLSAPRGRDEVERRQANLLQGILLVLIGLIAVLAVGTLVVQGAAGLPRALLGLGLLEPLFIIPLLLLRSGYFLLAATTTVAVFEFIVVATVVAVGPTTPGTGAAIAVPMTIAALVLRRPGLVVVTVVSIAAVLVAPFLPGHEGSATSASINLSVTLLLLGVVLDRFGVSVRDALAGELRHHREAEQARLELVAQAAELRAANERLTREMTERAAAEEARKAIEAKVLEVQKLESLGVLAGGIAHDFNNLLVAIMGNAGLALLDLPEGHPARASIIDVEVASRRAGELARQMLAYSGRSRFQIEPVELPELVRELLTLLQVSIGKGVILKLHLPEEPVVVDADAAQIRQVVMNLVINAADAIGTRSGTVTIRVNQLDATAEYLGDVHPGAGLAPGRYAALEVSDTGMGMDRETQGRIFDPFFTTKFTGRGLGLAAVLGIVRSHGGALRVYSEVGRGSTFRVVLPLSATSPRVAGTPARGEWRANATVLVVDDDPMVRSVAKRLLESFGLTVHVADGGAEAIERVAGAPDAIDGVLLDMTMPEMTGPEVYERLRAIRADLPIVLMSGYHEDELAADLAAGISGFIQKPFTPADLAVRMQAALQRDSIEPTPTPTATPGGVDEARSDDEVGSGRDRD